MKEERKRSLVPDPIFGLLDIQKVDTVEEDDELSLTYETAEDEIVPLKVVEFYDPDFGPSQEDTILSIYDGPRYGKLTIKELKKMCKDRELPLSGNKKTLIDRLDKHNEEQKKIIKEKEDKENKVILDSVKQKKHMLEVRVKKLAVLRKRKLDDLVEAQKTFDAIEAEVNEVKATLKSLDYLF
tara:strand:+ start:341 stop:889 length:549 start_codon:yes stop_codon:yes gene_type:complete